MTVIVLGLDWCSIVWCVVHTTHSLLIFCIYMCGSEARKLYIFTTVDSNISLINRR